MVPDLNFASGGLSHSVAFALIALLGYMFGRRTRNSSHPANADLQRELDRARQIAAELQQLAKRIRNDVAVHQVCVAKFKSETAALASKGEDDSWQQLSLKAEQLLTPTRKLAADLSASYEQLRRQTNQLLTFTNSRTDPECGVHTCRALDEHLDHLFAMPAKPQARLSLVMFAVADVKNSSSSPPTFVRFAQLAHETARENDFVARYGGDEVVVVMPETSLSGATIFGDRLIRRAEAELECTVRAGVVEMASTDSPHSLLSRADTALYSARTYEGPCLFQHTGETVRRCCVTSRRADESASQNNVSADAQRSSPPIAAVDSFSGESVEFCS